MNRRSFIKGAILAVGAAQLTPLLPANVPPASGLSLEVRLYGLNDTIIRKALVPVVRSVSQDRVEWLSINGPFQISFDKSVTLMKVAVKLPEELIRLRTEWQLPHPEEVEMKIGDGPYYLNCGNSIMLPHALVVLT